MQTVSASGPGPRATAPTPRSLPLTCLDLQPSRRGWNRLKNTKECYLGKAWELGSQVCPVQALPTHLSPRQTQSRRLSPAGAAFGAAAKEKPSWICAQQGPDLHSLL